MDIGAGLAVKGGTMVYAVCSLLDREGREQVDAFFRRNPGWTCDLPKDLPGRRHGEGVLMTPAHDGTDGFFFARMKKSWQKKIIRVRRKRRKRCWRKLCALRSEEHTSEIQ